MDIFLELAQPIYSSSLKFSFDLLFCLIVSVCRCFPLMSHNDCNCIDTYSLLPHDVFISRCSTFHLPGTHTLAHTHKAYRAAIIRAELKSAVKYESIYHLIYTNVQGAGAKERESERGGEGDSRTAARFANKGKAQMEGNLLQMLIN